MSEWLLTAAVHSISRMLFLRNRLRRARPVVAAEALRSVAAQRQGIAAGSRTLDGMLVQPHDAAATAAVLLCHGIGEVVDDWLAVQVLLARAGIASLVFDYTGYGRSRGGLSVLHCEPDAAAAWRHLRSRFPALPLTLLGYSMGSGVAAAVAAELAPAALILGGSFSSLREAAREMGVGAALAAGLPDAWRTRDELARLPMPVLLLHGEDDALFPSITAHQLAATGGPHCSVVTLPACTHDAPIFEPHLPFWSAAIAFMRVAARKDSASTLPLGDQP